MQFHRRCRDSSCDLRTPLEAGPAPAAECLVGDLDVTGIALVTLPHTIHTGIHTGPTMKAILFIDENMIPGESLPLFADLLIEARSYDIQKTIKLRALFHLLDEIRHFLDREVDAAGQILFEIIVKLTMF
jgi:hypothetical protein